MSKFKFVNIIDTIFLSVTTFLIIFAWIQFFIKNFMLSLVISTIISITVIFVIKWFKSKKHSAKQNQLNTNSRLACFKLAIQTMPSTKLTTTIKKLIPSKYLPKINKGDISFVKDNSTHTFTFHYSSELSEAKLLELIKTKKSNNLVIFCSHFNQDTIAIANAFKNKHIELINLEQLFEIFNNKNIEIDTSHIDLNKHKITLREILKNSLSRNKSKGYFISGLVLLFTSLIIPYRLYYVIFSSILFLLSLVCRFKPTAKTNHSIFD
ncbi:MAG: hypothetical protein IJ458_01820 [Clostridia bacterium]|nr:hypothetical protein [Clostridia bacterium]